MNEMSQAGRELLCELVGHELGAASEEPTQYSIIYSIRCTVCGAGSVVSVPSRLIAPREKIFFDISDVEHIMYVENKVPIGFVRRPAGSAFGMVGKRVS